MHSSQKDNGALTQQVQKHKKTKSQLSFTTMSGAAAGDQNSIPNFSIASPVAKSHAGVPRDGQQHGFLGQQPNFGPVHYHNNSGGVVQGPDLSTEAMMLDSELPRQISDQVFAQQAMNPKAHH